MSVEMVDSERMAAIAAPLVLTEDMVLSPYSGVAVGSDILSLLRRNGAVGRAVRWEARLARRPDSIIGWFR